MSARNVVIIWRRDIPALPNAAFYQRINALANNYSVGLLVPSRAVIDTAFSGRVTMHRVGLPMLSGTVTLGKMLNLIGFLVAATRFVMRCYPSKDTVIYTFQGVEALVGAVLSLFGFKWIADILDSPVLFREAATVYRRRREWLKAIPLFMFERLMSLALRQARLVVTVGDEINKGLYNQLVQDYRVLPQRIVMLPNGVNLELNHINPQPKTDKLRLFYVGSVSKTRGIETCLEAVEMLLAEKWNVELVFAGPVHDTFTGELLQRVNSSPYLRDNVQILGRVPHADVLGWIVASDICLYPFPRGAGLDEVMPIKVLEYLSMGKPVIASNLPGVCQFIIDGLNGILIEPSNSKQLYQAIAMLGADPQLRYRIGEQGRRSVIGRSWPQINERFLASLHPVLTSRAELTP